MPQSIAELAKQTIDELEFLPADKVGINTVVYADWDGTTQLIVSETESKPEDVCQSGVLTHQTPLSIYCLAENRQEAIDQCKQAADAVLAMLTVLSFTPDSGVLYIAESETTIRNIPDRTEFEAGKTFLILNTIGL